MVRFIVILYCCGVQLNPQYLQACLSFTHPFTDVSPTSAPRGCRRSPLGAVTGSPMRGREGGSEERPFVSGVVSSVSGAEQTELARAPGWQTMLSSPQIVSAYPAGEEGRPGAERVGFLPDGCLPALRRSGTTK